MIPVLFEATETKFQSNGLGRLSDAISCAVTEERNGQYELAMRYPMSGIHYGDIREERIIVAVPCDGGTPQPFRIYATSRPIDGVITVSAQHISYALKHMVVAPFAASTAVAAMNQIQTKIMGGAGQFTFWTDVDKAGSMDQKVPVACRPLLGGVAGSVLDTYGGEYEFDGYAVKLHARRGRDSGVTVRYGKNLTALTSDMDYSGAYTSAVAYWTKEERGETVTVVGDEVKSGHEGDYAYGRCAAIDMSQDYTDPPTKQQLNEAAADYMRRNESWAPKASIDLSFLPLWQTSDYEDVAALQRVRLCDTVTVEYPSLGVSATAKVTRTVYDVLAERYSEVGLGDARASLADAVTQDTVSGQQLQANTSWLQEAIDHASELIRGGLGGHVVINVNADGQPEEICVMDTDDIKTARRVWRWNMGGFGYSSTGYNGEYGTAITMDGQIVADYILTGKLRAGLITVGILSDSKGQSYWNMDTGELNIVANSFALTSGKTIGDIAEEEANKAVDGMSQSDVFNKLTQDGTKKGIWMDDKGELFINADYLKSGTVDADLIRTGKIQDKKSPNASCWDLDAGTLVTYDMTANNATISGTVKSSTFQGGKILSDSTFPAPDASWTGDWLHTTYLDLDEGKFGLAEGKIWYGADSSGKKSLHLSTPVMSNADISGANITGSIIKGSKVVSGRFQNESNTSHIDMDDGTLSLGNKSITYDGSKLSMSGELVSSNGSVWTKISNGALSAGTGGMTYGFINAGSSFSYVDGYNGNGRGMEIEADDTIRIDAKVIGYSGSSSVSSTSTAGITGMLTQPIVTKIEYTDNGTMQWYPGELKLQFINGALVSYTTANAQ